MSLLLDGGLMVLGGQHIAKALLWMQEHHRQHLGLYEDRIPAVFLRVSAVILHQDTPIRICRLATGHHHFHQQGRHEISTGSMMTLMKQVAQESAPYSESGNWNSQNLILALQAAGILHPLYSDYVVETTSELARDVYPRLTATVNEIARQWSQMYKFAFANMRRFPILPEMVDRHNRGKVGHLVPLTEEVLAAYPELRAVELQDLAEWMMTRDSVTAEDMEDQLELLWRRVPANHQQSPDNTDSEYTDTDTDTDDNYA